MKEFRIGQRVRVVKAYGHDQNFGKVGMIAYHTAAKSYFKVTCEKDNEWKGKAP